MICNAWSVLKIAFPTPRVMCSGSTFHEYMRISDVVHVRNLYLTQLGWYKVQYLIFWREKFPPRRKAESGLETKSNTVACELPRGAIR